MSDEEKLKKIKVAHDEALASIDLAVTKFRGQMAEIKKDLEVEKIAQLKAKLAEE